MWIEGENHMSISMKSKNDKIQQPLLIKIYKGTYNWINLST